MTTQGIADDDSEALPLLAVGTTADIYLVDEETVLRRYRDVHDATAEAALMRHVAEHGFPVAEVYSAQGRDLVMERLHGPTLLVALAAGEFNLHDGADIMADLHRRLHAIPAPRRAGDESAAGDDVVVHLNIHPGNIVLSESHGPALVDWANARTGSLDLDTAMSAIILGEVAVDSEGDYSRAARAMLVAFLAVADGNPLAQLDVAAQSRLNDPALFAGEKSLVVPAAALVRQYSRDVIIGGEPTAS
ncbi:aminoglycoside phosphotransferase family protein [Pengzhenrongella sp.]|jgi:aminoglycoside phosphotransferase (APT) family kinase protein|uniref:aminoglycoside phosphotransferase family protein n=1 Tax=Pengzhenrongella sp. TaxID=2888820 RepID=UPI002F958538